MVARTGELPPGYTHGLERPVRVHGAAKERLKLRRPADARDHLLLLYLNFRSVAETLIVMLSLPFALVGGVWFIWLLGYNLSVAVAVGFIALAGVAAETGVVMLIYLDHAWAGESRDGRRPTRARLYEAVDGRRGRAGPAEDDDGDGDHGRSAADPLGRRQPARAS